MTVKTVPYLDAGRELCITGSCILTASEDMLGDAIRLFEGDGAFCSHAAAVVRFPAELVGRERVTLIEALEHGPTPTYLSHYFSGFTGRLFLFTPAGLTPEIQTEFAAWCLDKVLLQVEYGFVSLGRQVAGHVEEEDPRKRLFCSEEVGMAWESSGLPRLASIPPKLAPQPSDIPRWWAGTLIELTGPFVAEA